METNARLAQRLCREGVFDMCLLRFGDFYKGPIVRVILGQCRSASEHTLLLPSSRLFQESPTRPYLFSHDPRAHAHMLAWSVDLRVPIVMAGIPSRGGGKGTTAAHRSATHGSKETIVTHIEPRVSRPFCEQSITSASSGTLASLATRTARNFSKEVLENSMGSPTCPRGLCGCWLKWAWGTLLCVLGAFTSIGESAKINCSDLVSEKCVAESARCLR